MVSQTKDLIVSLVFLNRDFKSKTLQQTKKTMSEMFEIKNQTQTQRKAKVFRLKIENGSM